jgi:enoyl-CoA hydratase/carnithine racemase
VLLTPEDAAALASAPAAWRETSVLHERPFLIVDLRSGDGGIALDSLAQLPVVVIGVGATHDACDVIAEGPDDLERLVNAIRRNPQASVTLVQLLRLSQHLDPHDGLVAESLAYATLQSGTEFGRWLSSRGDRVRKAETEPPVLVARHGSTLNVELNRPRLHNLYNAAMRDALSEALTIALVDTTIESVRLSGRGRSFCAGGDLAEFGTVSDPASAHLIRTAANTAPLFVALADRLQFDVHGAAVGAGCELAAFARHVTATGDATFRLPEVSMGLVPGAGGTVSVPRRVGRHRAAWLMLSGESIDASTALDWGLVDELVTGAADQT